MKNLRKNYAKTRNDRRKGRIVVSNRKKFHRLVSVVVVVLMLISVVQTGAFALEGTNTTTDDIMVQNIEPTTPGPPAGETPGEDSPAEELPNEDLPAEDSPAEELPNGDLPAEELPDGDLPSVQDSGDVNPPENNLPTEEPTPATIKVSLNITGVTLDGYDVPVFVEGTANQIAGLLAQNLETSKAGLEQVGYTFDAWYSDAALAESNKIADITTLEYTDGMNLYANFTAPVTPPDSSGGVEEPEPSLITVTLYVDGVQSGSPIPVVEGVGTIATPPNPAIPAGSVFGGWFMDEVFTTPFAPAVKIEASINLYAKITTSEFIVSFVVDGTTIETFTVKEGEIATKPIKEPNAPDGKQFLHWAEEGSETPYDFFAAVNRNITLVPVFTSSHYVSFISDGTQVEPVLVEDGRPFRAPETPITREGYEFKHWSKTVNGEAYDFTQTVNDTFTLYAVWTPKLVDYKVVSWIEKPNVVGAPQWPNDYQTYSPEPETLQAHSGTVIRDLFTTDISKIKYFEYMRISEPTTIQGNGFSVINALYNRIEYTLNFKIGSPEIDATRVEWSWNGNSGTSYNLSKDTVYSFTAKYEQYIGDKWPSVNDNATIVAYKNDGKAEYQPIGWNGENNVLSVSRRLYLAEDLIASPTTESCNFTLRFVKQPVNYDLHYWYQTLLGEKSESTYLGAGYVEDKELSQKVVTTPDFQPKDLVGYTIHKTNTSGSHLNRKYDFYYTRNRGAIIFTLNGGASDAAFGDKKDIMHGQDMKRYKPAIEPTKENNAFKGWYYDALFTKPVDWEKDIMTVSVVGQTTHLYAKWSAGEYTVSFFDNVANVDGTPLATQSVEKNAQVDGSKEIAITVDGNIYTLKAGAVVPGYGEFMGWKWKLRDGTIASFNFGMPVTSNLSLYANWKQSGFTVTYDKGIATEGTVPTNSQKYTLGTSVKISDNSGRLTSKNAGAFIGWLNSVDGSLCYPDSTMKISGNTTLTAQFVNPDVYAGATFAPGYEGATQPSKLRGVKPGKYLTLLGADAFTREGYELVGWQSDDITYTLGEKFGELSADKTFTAIWNQVTKKYTINFVADKNGSIGGTTSYQHIVEGTTWKDAGIEVPVASPNNDSYFYGWEAAIPSDDTAITKDMTFTAKFKLKRSLELLSASATKVYDGESLTKADITEESKKKLLPDYAEVTMDKASTLTDVKRDGNFNVISIENVISDYKIFRDINGTKTDVTHEYNGFVERGYGTLTVTPKPVTVKANSETKFYGDPDPEFGYVVTDSAGKEITTKLTIDIDRVQGENVGVYNHGVVYKANTSNYDITSVKGPTLTIVKRDVTITANSGAHTFDGSVLEFSPEVSYSYPNGEPNWANSLLKKPEASATVDLKVNVGNYPVAVQYDATSVANKNYNITAVDGAFNIVSADKKIIIAVGKAGKIYGDNDPALSATVTMDNKILTPQEYAALGISFNITRDTGEKAGEYNTNITDLVSTNYNEKIFEIITPKFEIQKRPITIAAQDSSKVYGTEDLAFEAVVTSDKNPAIVAGDTLVYDVVRTNTDINDVGEYADSLQVRLGADAEVNSNYLINTVPGTFTITKNDLEIGIKANDAEKNYGEPDPATLVVEFTNLPVGVELIAGTDYIVTRAGKLDDGSTNNAGSYDINVALTDTGIAKLKNYSYTLENGKFTIKPVTATVTLGTFEKVYADSDPAAMLNPTRVEGLVNNDSLVYGVKRETGENVKDGGYRIYGEFDATNNPNYNIVFVEGVLNITKRTITVTPKDDEKVYGNADPDFKGKADIINVPERLPDGNSPSAPDFTIERNPGDNVGEYPLTVDPGNNPNYNIVPGVVEGGANLTITKASAEIVVSNNAKIFGTEDPNPITVSSVTGEVLGNKLVYALTRTVGENAGKYAISVVIDTEAFPNKNYAITLGKGEFEITPQSIEAAITPTSYVKEYGDADPTLEATVVGELPEGVSYRLVRESAGTEAGEDVKYEGVFTPEITGYKINVELVSTNPNVDVSKIQLGEGKLTINPKAIDVSAPTVDKIYSAADPDYVVTTTGKLDKDIIVAHITRPDKFQPGGEDVGNHELKLTVDENKNYKITAHDGILAINPKAVTVTAEDKSKLYGQSDPQLTAKADGLVKGDTLDISLVRDKGEAVGNYPINLSVAPNKNYSIATVNGNFTIAQKEITITVQNASKIYGDRDPGFFASYDGIEPGDHVNLQFTRQPGEDVGSYVISANVVGSTNYKVNIIPGTFTINKRSINITPVSAGKVYGNGDPTFSAVVNGTIGATAPQYTISRQPGENVGTYAMSITLVGNNANYDIQTGTGTFAITPKPVTITANNNGKMFGETDPILTAVVDGAVNGETLNYSISRELGEDVGNYGINVVPTANANYEVTVKEGVFTIAPRDADVAIIPNNVGKAYGSSDPTLTATVIGTVDGDALNYTLSRVAGENVGDYTISVVLGSNPNYKIHAGTGVFGVTPKDAEIIAASATKIAGTEDPQFTASVSGTVNGDSLSYTIEREPGEEVGNYSINVQPTSNPNYNITTMSGVLAITSPAPVDPTNPADPTGPAAPPAAGATDPEPPITPVGPPVTTDTPVGDIGATNNQITEPDLVALPGNDLPLADGNLEDLAENQVPLASNWASWALLNLILMVGTALVSIALIISYFTGKKRNDGESRTKVKYHGSENQKEDTTIKRRGLVRLISILVAAVAIVVFFLTEDMSRPMVLTDRWTAFMAVIAILQVVMAFFAKKVRDDDSSDENIEGASQLPNIE